MNSKQFTYDEKDRNYGNTIQKQPIELKNLKVKEQASANPINPSNSLQMFVPNEYQLHANGEIMPAKMFCPKCHTLIRTNLNYENGAGTWVMCLTLFICTFCLFFIPFCMNDCKDIIHLCPKCSVEVGITEYSIC